MKQLAGFLRLLYFVDCATETIMGSGKSKESQFAQSSSALGFQAEVPAKATCWTGNESRVQVNCHWEDAPFSRVHFLILFLIHTLIHAFQADQQTRPFSQCCGKVRSEL